MPIFGLDYDEESNPLEAGLEQTIDFDKGCFPGQEICARLKNSGHPSKMLVGLQFDGPEPPPPGTPLAQQGLPAGKITSSAYSPTLERAIALASVLWEFHETGTELTAGDHRAIIVDLPMIKAEEKQAPEEPDEE
jgi:folate-binding protein YgfZ